ncbi:hypothetical protein AHAS_Ahas05G0076400 [Arachis hypogaea]
MNSIEFVINREALCKNLNSEEYDLEREWYLHVQGRNGLEKMEEEHAKWRKHEESKEKSTAMCACAQTCVRTHNPQSIATRAREPLHAHRAPIQASPSVRAHNLLCVRTGRDFWRSVRAHTQARHWLAFMDSESGLLEEHTNSLPPSPRDHHSSNNEKNLYSSVGSSEISLSESGDSTMADPPRRITLREAGAPDINLQPLQIRYPALDPNFELKTGTVINLLPKYNGLSREDPLSHLKDFQVACSTARRHGADEATVLVFAFPFSLKEKTKEWFYTQPEDVISNWDLLRKEFLKKFYPPQKTDKLRKEISCIVQKDRKTLYEYCERFKKDESQDKFLLDASSGGSLTKNKTAEEAWEIIVDSADSTQHSRARNPQPEALSEVSPSGYAVLTKTLDEITILLRQITQGQQILQALLSPPPQPLRIEGLSRSCGICACNTHYTDECPQF